MAKARTCSSGTSRPQRLTRSAPGTQTHLPAQPPAPTGQHHDPAIEGKEIVPVAHRTLSSPGEHTVPSQLFDSEIA